MLICVERILNQAMLSGIPIKGAITYGKMTADLNRSFYFGKPLIDAYELQKELLLYGVVLHHTSEKRLNVLRIKRTFETFLVLQSPVPMKSGNITHYLVNWTLHLKKGKDPLDYVTKLYLDVSGAPRLYVDNTIEFVRWIQARKLELEEKTRNKDKPV